MSVLALAGCKKDKDESATPTPTPTEPAITVYEITGTPVFTAKVDGITYTYMEGVDGVTTYATAAQSSGKAAYFIEFKIGSQMKAKVMIGGLAVSGSTPPSDQAFIDFFTIGPKNYAPIVTYNGVDVAMKFGSDQLHATGAPQAGSSFVVTDVQPVDDGSGIAKVKVRATFKCNIENYDGMKAVTNGQFVGVFQKVG